MWSVHSTNATLLALLALFHFMDGKSLIWVLLAVTQHLLHHHSALHRVMVSPTPQQVKIDSRSATQVGNFPIHSVLSGSGPVFCSCSCWNETSLIQYNARKKGIKWIFLLNWVCFFLYFFAYELFQQKHQSWPLAIPYGSWVCNIELLNTLMSSISSILSALIPGIRSPVSTSHAV